MNDLEQLIAGLARPEPRDGFDQRIRALLNQKRTRSRMSAGKIALAWCGSLACVGIVGFSLGRLSAIAQTTPQQVTVAAPSSDSPNRTSTNPASVVNIRLREDQFAALFLPPGHSEGMLGKGPVKIEVSTSP
jgi:hypothetical protein